MNDTNKEKWTPQWRRFQEVKNSSCPRCGGEVDWVYGSGDRGLEFWSVWCKAECKAETRCIESWLPEKPLWPGLSEPMVRVRGKAVPLQSIRIGSGKIYEPDK
jgi:hypothetical protein